MEENEKNKEDKDANQEKNINIPQLSFSVLTIHDFKEKNKKTKFTPKSNNRWILVPIKKENKDKKEVIASDKEEKNNNNNSNKKEEQNEIIDNDLNIEKDKTKENQNEVKAKKSKINSDEEKVSKTLEKWKNLQKSIKEEISLEELMIEKQKQDSSQLREKFKDYYNVKLQSRYEYEKIKNLNSNDKIISNKEKEKGKDSNYSIDVNIDRVLLDTCEPIKNLMFLFRNYYEYTVKLVSLITEDDDKEKVDSLVELFCNQFYDNILIPSQNQNNVEISLLIYKLLEDYIISMNSATIDDFLSDDSFIGKFISSFVRKDEFRLFFGKLLNPILLNIEQYKNKNYSKNKNDVECLDVSLANIKSKLLKTEKNKEKKSPNASPNISMSNIYNKDDEIDLSILYKEIKRTCIEFKKNIDLDENVIKYNNEDYLNNNSSNSNIILTENEDKLEINPFSLSDDKMPNLCLKRSMSKIKEEYNNEYSEDLNQEKIISKIINEQNKDMKDFYIHQLELIGSDPDIFTNNGLKNIMNEVYQKDSTKILLKYRENFIFIKNTIDSILQELINKINIIPHSLKCLCKIISILIQKKFPNLPKYYRNSFIGKLLFDKCIFPILSLDSKNSIINRIFSSCTKKCVNVIVNVLSNANRGSLYMTNSDTEKTIFNYYLIEIIPILNEFYDKLMDVKLPEIIEKNISFVDEQIKNNTDNRIFHFKRKKNPDIKINQKKQNEQKDKIKNDENKGNANSAINNNQTLLYDYFEENPDEIMRLQAICFSITDVLFILKLLKDKDKKFKNLPRYEYFKKTIERIVCDDYKLEEQEKEKANSFFIVYKDERNTQLEKLFKSKKNSQTTFFTDEKMDKDPSVILARIKFCIKNILKNVELNFTYLDKSTTTDKFFSAIYYELDEAGENTEILDQIPIKWYSQYIYENKKYLDIKYRKNDYQLLFDELSEEENKKLIELKNITSKLITKNNINLKCAEELLNKVNFSLEDILEEKKIAKIEKFIDTEEIKVCILTTKNEGQKIKIRNAKDCDLNTNENHIETEKNKKIILCHANYIKDFISKFSYNNWEDINRPPPIKLIKEDIQKGNREYQIYQTFKDYMDIIKKKIKAPVNNPNLFNDITDIGEILDKISDYILQQIYKYSYIPIKFKEENLFYQKIKSYGWITPSMLDIKKISIKQLDYTKKCIENLDNAFSVNDKLNCIRDAHASLNNVFKFSNGIDSDAGQDEITPIFQYAIIQAKPERIIFNINYIKAFLDESELSGSKGFLVTQIESATSYINAINHETLRMSKEEFKKNIDKWSKLNDENLKKEHLS